MASMSRRRFLGAATALTGSLALGTLTGCGAGEKSSETAADPVFGSDVSDVAKDRFVGAFWNISDAHIDPTLPENSDRFLRALSDIAAHDTIFDVIVINGDITDNGYPEHYELFRSLVSQSAFTLNDFAFTMGNHEQFLPDTLDPALFAKARDAFCAAVGRTRVYSDYKMNGAHLYLMGPDADPNINWVRFNVSNEQLTWLDEGLSQDEADGVLSCIFMHEPLFDTVRYTGRGQWVQLDMSLENEEALHEVVARHPKAIYFSGHTHAYPDTVLGEGGQLFVGSGSVTVSQTRGGLEQGSDVLDGSYGWLVEIYEHTVEFSLRDFTAGEWVEELSYSHALSGA